MKTTKIKLALAALLTALVSVEYVLACVKNVNDDCAAECNPCFLYTTPPTVLFGSVLKSSSNGAIGQTGYVSTFLNQNADCICTYQYNDRGTITTVTCGPFGVTRGQANKASATCNF